MEIITCPFCKWSAAYDIEDNERRARFNEELSEHLRDHLYDETI